MDVSFFERLFEMFYSQLSTLLYSQEDMLRNKIIRVDSTMVAETSAKLSQEMNLGHKKDCKKQINWF